MEPVTYHQKLKTKMDKYVHLIYTLTREFPKEEIYGITSQIRRSAVSVILNYIEGYARGSKKVNRNFLQISYGSLQESKYLLDFCVVEKYLKLEEYKRAAVLADDIGAMLWGIIRKLKD